MMIIKHDLSHIQQCLVQAIKDEIITGTNAARMVCEFINEGRFDDDGKAIDQDWFFGIIKKYPYDPTKNEPKFKFKEWENVCWKSFIYPVIGSVIERYPKGKTLTSKDVPFISNDIKAETNMYLIKEFDDPTGYHLVHEEQLRKLTPNEETSILKS